MKVGRVLWALLSVSCTVQAEEAPPAVHHIEEGAVLHSQRWFSEEWRKKFNAGDVVYCLQAYLPDATLHISFGPLAQLVEKLIAPLKNPATLRGQLEIGAFWNASKVVLGFEEMQAFDDHGEYASTAMVVDADTVIVTSPIAFKSLYGQVHGEVLSEMWVRTEDKMTWKIRSAMVALQDLGPSHSDGAAPATKTPEKQRDASADKPTPKPTAAPQPTNRSKDEVLAGDLNNTMGANGTNGAAAVSKGHSTFLAGLAILVAVSVGAVLVRRAQNRRAAAISGFESMLG